CLHLNVYTSQTCRESNASCAVLFLIHGGLGIFESTMKFPDETLVRNFVSQDIVIVSTAYRLGMFGAIALGDENAVTANLAMHDILAAVKFTRSEIAVFGGDMERITAMGHSAGGRYALMIAFSPGISKPGEKRLINGVVTMSSPVGLETQEETVMRSHEAASELGCEGTAYEIIRCLRGFDTDTIVEAVFNMPGRDFGGKKGPLSLTMAGELFPIENERELRESRDPIRLMTGTTVFEIPGFSGKDRVNRLLGVSNTDECYNKYLYDTFGSTEQPSPALIAYRQNGTFKPAHFEGSHEFIMSTHIYAKYQAEIGGEVYLYEYDYPVHGQHADDAYFVLGFHEFEKDENEEWLSRVYPKYFSQFIKGERPAEDWYPVKPHLMNYYSVNRNITDDVFPHMKFG
ncbi:hypothetical protein PENTCL1PPCAC_922, partial [Pristionchus entomophagus]